MRISIPLVLKTKFGRNQFYLLNDQYNLYKDFKSLIDFKKRCNEDYIKINHYLNYFLEDDYLSKTHTLNEKDKTGWEHLNKMCDVAASLKYFSTRTV